MRTLIELARSRRSLIAGRFASSCLSASCYRLAEYVGFLPVVEAELELREVEREVLLADLIEHKPLDADLEEIRCGRG